ncbi:hypothetical protein CALVIDRAFT_562923 [Calocera viscosa TUFC12733]|uniref:Myb-like domain-containing protein n=1 Tax=Calocera viscosa (strain TUFC12733) TaxID=1330018 RepID=A0A167NCQ8_CALVF|nr:hypothetical protein CALVIDRAFT_562923 [Calocera viscosa TUFC12733]
MKDTTLGAMTMSRADIQALFNSGPLNEQKQAAILHHPVAHHPRSASVSVTASSTPTSTSSTPFLPRSASSSAHAPTFASLLLKSPGHDNHRPAAAKQRRVSLPASQHRQVFNEFRDEMRLLERDKGKGRATHSAHASGHGSPAKKTFAQALPDAHSANTGLGLAIGEDASSSEDNKPSTKKARKLWTKEETQMLIDGCEAHGVGNWTTILNDPTYSFQSRSATDLKDRFRTYFPEEYRKHYPNAKTHINRSRASGSVSGGIHCFERKEQVRKRPFCAEEDQALRTGFRRHGSHWATIAREYDVFKDRKLTELRDRFRHIEPELYRTTGNKPKRRPEGSSTAAGKKSRSEPPSPPLGALEMGKRRGRRKSMVVPKPRRIASMRAGKGGMSEGEDFPGIEQGEDEMSELDGAGTEMELDGEPDGDIEAMQLDAFLPPPGMPSGSNWASPPPLPRPSTAGGFPSHSMSNRVRSSTSVSAAHTRSPSTTFPSSDTFNFSLPFILPSQPARPESLYSENTSINTGDDNSLSQWSASASGDISTWATNSASSPSDLLFPSASHSTSNSPHGFPFPMFNGYDNGRKPPPAWGPTNWLAPNARLSGDAPAGSQSHNVVDRYDLYSTAAQYGPHDFASEAGAMAASWSMAQESQRDRDRDSLARLYRGFTHHSTAGDLIRGSGVRAGGVAGMELPSGWQPLLPDWGKRRGGGEVDDIWENEAEDAEDSGNAEQSGLDEVDLHEPAFGIGLEELERAARAMQEAEEAAKVAELAHELGIPAGSNLDDLQMPSAEDIQAATAALESFLPAPDMPRSDDATTPTMSATALASTARPPSPLSLSQPLLPLRQVTTPTAQMRELHIDEYAVSSSSALPGVPENGLLFSSPTDVQTISNRPGIRRSNSLFDQLISLRGPSPTPSSSFPSLDLATAAWDMRNPSSLASEFPALFGNMSDTFETDALDLAEVIGPSRGAGGAPPSSMPTVGAAKKRKRVSWGGQYAPVTMKPTGLPN